MINPKLKLKPDLSRRKGIRSIMLLVLLGVSIILGSGYFKKSNDFYPGLNLQSVLLSGGLIW